MRGRRSRGGRSPDGHATTPDLGTGAETTLGGIVTPQSQTDCPTALRSPILIIAGRTKTSVSVRAMAFVRLAFFPGGTAEQYAELSRELADAPAPSGRLVFAAGRVEGGQVELIEGGDAHAGIDGCGRDRGRAAHPGADDGHLYRLFADGGVLRRASVAG